MRNRSSKIYNLFIVFESLILVACSLWGLFKFNTDESIVTMTLIVGLYINIYLLWFSFNSLFNEDSLQMVLSALVHTFLTFISTYHYWKQPIHHEFNTALLVMWLTTLFFQLSYLILTPIVIYSFGNKIFESVGGDPVLQRLYKQGLLFFSCLKFDLFLSILCLLLASARLVDQFWNRENVLNILSCAFNVVWLIAGYHCIQNEKQQMTIVWAIFGLIGQPLYIVYKTIQLWNDTYYSSSVYPTEIKIQFIICAVLWLLLRAFVIVFSLTRIRSNFNKGLAEIWQRTSDYRLIADEQRRRVENQHRIDDIRREALLTRQQRAHGDVIYGIVPATYDQQYQRQPMINSNYSDDDGAV